MLVTDLLVESFPDILNAEFTAGMEEVLDKIEDGQEDWKKAMERFYQPFSADLERAEKEMRDVKGAGEPTDIACPKCEDGKMTIRWGRNGEFLACSNYPECKSTSNFTRDDQGNVIPQKEEEEATDEVCEKCGKPMQIRFSRYGKFLGCSGYPECKNIKKTGNPPLFPSASPVPTVMRVTSNKNVHDEERFSTVAVATQNAPLRYGIARLPNLVRSAKRRSSSRRPPNAPAPRGVVFAKNVIIKR